ncbi:hypothetical protein [Polaribacter sp.]|uniref:hypothetical protein n=1 Tax=Polaribacter sp. TaxID=1920175 RepID=UPI00404758E2
MFFLITCPDLFYAAVNNLSVNIIEIIEGDFVFEYDAFYATHHPTQFITLSMPLRTKLKQLSFFICFGHYYS